MISPLLIGIPGHPSGEKDRKSKKRKTPRRTSLVTRCGANLIEVTGCFYAARLLGATGIFLMMLGSLFFSAYCVLSEVRWGTRPLPWLLGMRLEGKKLSWQKAVWRAGLRFLLPPVGWRGVSMLDLASQVRWTNKKRIALTVESESHSGDSDPVR